MILVVVLVAGLIFVRNTASRENIAAASVYDGFAQCLADAGAKFYGAFWCPHCADQKELFKKSTKLPYVECSTPNGQGRNQVCTDAGVESYPTWIFADGSKLDGVQQFDALAEKTNCVVPTEPTTGA